MALGVLLSFSAVRDARQSTGGCSPADPSRNHFTPPATEVAVPPPTTTDRPELAERTWVGWAKPRAVDFLQAVLRDDANQARDFVAPEYDLDISALRQRLGIACPPDFFTAHWASVSAEQAVIEPTFYYAESTVTFRIIFGPHPDRWRIVAIEPQGDAR